MLKYPAVLHKDEDGLWISFPDFGSAGTQGDTMDEIVKMGEDLLRGCLGALFDEGKQIPEPSVLKSEDIIYINVPPDVAMPILIRKYRNELDLTQGEVAEKLRAPYQSIQKLERIGCNPTLKTLDRIASALGKKLVVDLQ